MSKPSSNTTQNAIERGKRALMGVRYQAKVLTAEAGKEAANDTDLEEKAVDTVDSSKRVSAAASKGASVAQYHSELAMQAARRMRRTRQKQKTGQEVCHHLRMMLTSEPAPSREADQPRQAADEPQIALGF